MRMVAVRLRHYRRFEEQATLDLTPRVVAVVGPNEAGKSSLLDALERIGDPASSIDFSPAEFTGREPPAEDAEIVSALFELDSDDYEAIADVFGASKVRLWKRVRTADGEARGEVIPKLERDRSLLLKVEADLKRMLRHKSILVSEYLNQTPSTPAPVGDISRSRRELAEEVSVDLDDSEETLTSEVRHGLDMLADAIGDPPSKSPHYIRDLAAECRHLGAEHAEDHPEQLVNQILEERFPQVRVLRDNDRELNSSYPFEEYETPPAPLENLLHLAGIRWRDLRSAARVAGNPVLADLIRRGNEQLEERLRGSWKQSNVSVALEEQGGVLNVYPYDADSKTHSRIEDRSDGFRSFLALLTFTARHSEDDERRLILAIDEAELHLHYNAQADLVRILTRQTLATQIVYTTHSAGCLPEDLGSAIRVVRQRPQDRSSIDNGFWSAQSRDKTSGGFTSLLMAMGADAVAFTPARHAVITEGPSDALLLPALIREALGESPDFPLGLQVAGGLAWTPPRRLKTLEIEAAHVVYLTDSDSAGKDYCFDLKRAGVDSKRIFSLRAGSANGLTVEDFVHKKTYVYVVNFLLRKLRAYDGPSLRASDLPSKGMARFLDQWTKARKLEPLSKTAIAEHVLRVSKANFAYIYWDSGEEAANQVLRSNRQSAVLRLYEDLRTALDLQSGAV